MGMLATGFVMAVKLNQTPEGKTWLENFNKFSFAMVESGWFWASHIEQVEYGGAVICTFYQRYWIFK